MKLFVNINEGVCGSNAGSGPYISAVLPDDYNLESKQFHIDLQLAVAERIKQLANEGICIIHGLSGDQTFNYKIKDLKTNETICI